MFGDARSKRGAKAKDARLKQQVEWARDVLWARSIGEGSRKFRSTIRGRRGQKPSQEKNRLIEYVKHKKRVNFVLCLSLGYVVSTGPRLASILDLLLSFFFEPDRQSMSITIVRADSMQAYSWLAFHPKSAEVEARVRTELAGEDLSSDELDQQVYDALLEEVYPDLAQEALKIGHVWSEENNMTLEALSEAGVNVRLLRWNGLAGDVDFAPIHRKMQATFASDPEFRARIEHDVAAVRETALKYGREETVSEGVARMAGQRFLELESAALELLSRRIEGPCFHPGTWMEVTQLLEDKDIAGEYYGDDHMPLYSIDGFSKTATAHQMERRHRVEATASRWLKGADPARRVWESVRMKEALLGWSSSPEFGGVSPESSELERLKLGSGAGLFQDRPAWLEAISVLGPGTSSWLRTGLFPSSMLVDLKPSVYSAMDFSDDSSGSDRSMGESKSRDAEEGMVAVGGSRGRGVAVAPPLTLWQGGVIRKDAGGESKGEEEVLLGELCHSSRSG